MERESPNVSWAFTAHLDRSILVLIIIILLLLLGIKNIFVIIEILINKLIKIY